MSTLVSALQDAAASREAWPDALKALTEAAGVAGAVLIISNKNTGNVEEACFFGLSAEFKSDYIRHYAALDPYSPLLDGSWKKLSECLPDPVLRRSEWYRRLPVGRPQPTFWPTGAPMEKRVSRPSMARASHATSTRRAMQFPAQCEARGPQASPRGAAQPRRRPFAIPVRPFAILPGHRPFPFHVCRSIAYYRARFAEPPGSSRWKD
jgi:hypothetical protein